MFQYFQVEVEQFNLFCLCSISNSLSLPLWYRHWGDIENKIIKDMIQWLQVYDNDNDADVDDDDAFDAGDDDNYLLFQLYDDDNAVLMTMIRKLVTNICSCRWTRKTLMLTMLMKTVIILFCRWTATTTRQCSPTASPASCCPSSWTGSHSASSFPFIPRHQTGWTTSFLKETKHSKLTC